MFKMLPILSLVALSLFVSCEGQLTWTAQTFMPVNKSDTIEVLVNNLIYSAGGCISKQAVTGSCLNTTNRMDIYNPVTNTWSLGASMPRNNFRYTAAAVGSIIYYFSGRDLNDNIYQFVDMYNTTSNSWTTVTSASVTSNCPNCLARSDCPAFVNGTRLFITGGYFQNYSTRTDTVVLDTSVTPLQFNGNIVPAKIESAGDQRAVVANGNAYVFGGFLGTDFCNPLNTMEVYNFTTNTWSLVAHEVNTNVNDAGGRGDVGIATLFGDVFLVGGETKSQPCNVATGGANAISIPQNYVEYFSTSSNTFSIIASLPISVFRFNAIAWNNSIYTFGGQETDSAVGNITVEDTGYFPLSSQVYAMNVASLAPGNNANNGASSSSSSGGVAPVITGSSSSSTGGAAPVVGSSGASYTSSSSTGSHINAATNSVHFSGMLMASLAVFLSAVLLAKL